MTGTHIHAAAKWKHPRRTIATRFENNDLGYATDGAYGASLLYSIFDMAPSTTKQMTLLDYGCGTGRHTRPLSPLFKSIVGYDPTPECIQLFHHENGLCEKPYPNLVLTHDINQVPQCDLAVCINVIEHLTVADGHQLIHTLQEKVSGPVIINYRPSSNHVQMLPFLTDEQIKEDQTGMSVIRLRKLQLRK